MGVVLDRKKKKNIVASVIYRLQKLIPFGAKVKFKLFLNLTWIFNRLSHEAAFKVYNHSNNPSRLKTLDFIFKYLDNTSNVLDLGCKEGELSYAIAQKAKSVTGVDYDGISIEIAKNKFQKPNLSFENTEAIEFLSKNNTHFEVLILSHILEHLDNPKEFLLSFKKYFKYIFIEVPDFDNSYLNIFRSDLNLNLIYSDDDHITEFDRDELKSLIESCGIEILVEEYRFGVQKFWCEVL